MARCYSTSLFDIAYSVCSVSKWVAKELCDGTMATSQCMLAAEKRGKSSEVMPLLLALL